MEATISQAGSLRAGRAGWVTRSYPAVLDTWRDLTWPAREAARLLYSDCEPGALVEITHSQFRRRIGVKDESSSRDAFARLEAVGVLRCVFRRRGRCASQIYRLGDPIAAYQRQGLGIWEPDPQLLLPFALEEVQGQEDLGGGVLRLVTGDQPAGASPRLAAGSAGEPGASALRLMAGNPGPGPDCCADEVLNPGPGPDSIFAEQPAEGCAEKIQAGHNRPAEAGDNAASRRRAAGATAADAGRGRQEADRSQPTTSQGIVAGKTSARSVVATRDAAAVGAESDQLGTPPVPRHSNGDATLPEQRIGGLGGSVGTGGATRAGAPAPSNQARRNLYTTNSSNQAPSARALAPAEFADVLRGAALDEDEQRAGRVAYRVLQAIRRAESRLKIARGDPRYMRGEWPAKAWGDLMAVMGPDAAGHVTELLDDLHTHDYGRSGPGAFVVSRLRKIERLAEQLGLARRLMGGRS